MSATVLYHAYPSEFKSIFGTSIKVQEQVLPLGLSSTSDRWPCSSENSSTHSPIFQGLLPKVDIMCLLGLGLREAGPSWPPFSLYSWTVSVDAAIYPLCSLALHAFQRSKDPPSLHGERLKSTRKLFHSLFSHLAPDRLPPCVPIAFLHNDPNNFQFPKALSRFCLQFWVPSTTF